MTTINKQLGIRDNIVPIIVDKEKMTITAGRLIINGYRDLRVRSLGQKQNPACVTRAVEVLPSLKKYPGQGHPRDINKDITEGLGMSPKRYYNLLVSKIIEVYVDPWEDFILKYCRGCGGRLSEWKVNAFHRNKEVLYQAQKDGQHNIIPILMALESSPKELKQKLGKGLWKYICGNSYSRNTKLSTRLSRMGLFTGDARVPIEYSKGCPTSILDYVCTYTQFRDDADWIVQALKKEKKLTKVDDEGFRSILNTYRDTKRMYRQLGLDWKPKLVSKWSIDELEEVHKVYSEKVTSLEYSKDFIECLKGFEKEFTYKGYKAELLTSRYDIAQEGREMKHCVASYAGKVANGNYLVYSVKNGDDKRVSTLGLRKVTMALASRWNFDQHYGKCDTPIKDVTLKILAKKLVNNFNKNLEGEENVEDVKELVCEEDHVVPLPMWQECTFN